MEFEVFGYYEDFWLEDGGYLGKRDVEKPTDRKLGSDGIQYRMLTENLPLQRNLKHVTVKASPQNPLRIASMICPKCGRIIEKAKATE